MSFGAVEEGDQQRCDMGAVDLRVGHDNDLVVAQIGRPIMRARTGAERLQQIGKLLVLSELVARGRTDVEDFSRNGSTACEARSRACLADPPAESPSTMNNSEPLRRGIRAIGELARQPQFADRGLPRDLLLHASVERVPPRARSTSQAAWQPGSAAPPANGRRRRAWPRRRAGSASAVWSLPSF